MVLGNKFCTNPFKNCFSWCPKITIVLCIVVCLVAKPLNRSEAEVDFAMTQNLLLFKYKLLCYQCWLPLQQGQPHSKSKAWQLSTQNVKWPIGDDALVA